MPWLLHNINRLMG